MSKHSTDVARFSRLEIVDRLTGRANFYPMTLGTFREGLRCLATQAAACSMMFFTAINAWADGHTALAIVTSAGAVLIGATTVVIYRALGCHALDRGEG